MTLIIKKEAQQIKAWKILNAQPIYLSNRQVSGLPTSSMATEWSLVKEKVLAPTKNIVHLAESAKYKVGNNK